jgi:nucleotide-binding universal stress UspA family protein
MFKKILVAIDASEMADRVFEEALSLAKSNEASLILLHVLSAEEENSPMPVPYDIFDIYPAAGNELTLETWREQWEAFVQQGLDLLQKRADRAKRAGIEAEYTQVSGSPGRVICHLARDRYADLIVVGHRGLSGLSEMFLGSVSNYVLHHAPCSVLTVHLHSSDNLDTLAEVR